jgi:hypothetical protein
MEFIERVKNVLFSPKSFFAGIKKEKGVNSAFGYFAVISLIGALLAFLINTFFGPYFNDIMSSFLGVPMPQEEFDSLLIISILFYGLSLGVSFISAGLLHVWILIFGGKSNYSKTYQLYVYSSTPNFLFSWIPFIGFLSSFYYLALLIIGTPEVHKEISMNKSILMYVLPTVIFFILFLIIFGLTIAFFTPLFSTELVGKAFGFL